MGSALREVGRENRAGPERKRVDAERRSGRSWLAMRAVLAPTSRIRVPTFGGRW